MVSLDAEGWIWHAAEHRSLLAPEMGRIWGHFEMEVAPWKILELPSRGAPNRDVPASAASSRRLREPLTCIAFTYCPLINIFASDLC